MFRRSKHPSSQYLILVINYTDAWDSVVRAWLRIRVELGRRCTSTLIMPCFPIPFVALVLTRIYDTLLVLFYIVFCFFLSAVCFPNVCWSNESEMSCE